MIKVMGIGNLGKDPEIRHTPSGSVVANISVGCQRYVKKERVTEWVRLVLFGKTAENAGKYLSKGAKIYFEGELQTRSWDDRDGKRRYITEVVVSKVEYLTPAKNSVADSGGWAGGNADYTGRWEDQDSSAF